jgi:phage baseplate assembly protein W
MGETHNEGIHNAFSSRNAVRRVKARIRVGQVKRDHEGDGRSVYLIQK